MTRSSDSDTFCTPDVVVTLLWHLLLKLHSNTSPTPDIKVIPRWFSLLELRSHIFLTPAVAIPKWPSILEFGVPFPQKLYQWLGFHDSDVLDAGSVYINRTRSSRMSKHIDKASILARCNKIAWTKNILDQTSVIYIMILHILRQVLGLNLDSGGWLSGKIFFSPVF
jgi:hypothetical protein